MELINRVGQSQQNVERGNEDQDGSKWKIQTGMFLLTISKGWDHNNLLNGICTNLILLIFSITF